MKVMSNRIAMILSIVIFSLSLIFQTAHAEIFKWVDEKGTVHFTEDPATIPEKYWEKVKSRTTEEDLMSPEERARAKKQYEEEVREKLKKEGKEYDAKEFERKFKELEERQKRGQIPTFKGERRKRVKCQGAHSETGAPVYGECIDGKFTGYFSQTGKPVYGNCDVNGRLRAYDPETGKQVLGKCE